MDLGRLLAHPGPEGVVPWSRVAVAEWARREMLFGEGNSRMDGT